MGPSISIDGDARPRVGSVTAWVASMGPSISIDGDLSNPSKDVPLL